MAQFDVCELRSPGGGFVVVLQSDLIADLGTRVVAPLYDASGVPSMSQLHVEVSLGQQNYLAQIDRLSTIPAKSLRPPLGNVLAYDDRLKRALDFLFFGI